MLFDTPKAAHPAPTRKGATADRSTRRDGAREGNAAAEDGTVVDRDRYPRGVAAREADRVAEGGMPLGTVEPQPDASPRGTTDGIDDGAAGRGLVRGRRSQPRGATGGIDAEATAPDGGKLDSDMPRGATGGIDDGAAAVGVLEGAISRVRSVDAVGLAPPEIAACLASVVKLRSAVDALEAKLVAEADRLGKPCIDAERVLRDAGCSVPAAKRSIHRARVLDSMPRTAETLSAGKITVEHADALVRAAEFSGAEAVEGSGGLLAAAVASNPERTRRVASKWVRSRGEGLSVEDRHARQRRLRSLGFGQSDEGMLRAFVLMDSVAGAAFRSVIDDTAQKFHDADRARQNRGGSQARTFAQCRVDALEALVNGNSGRGSTDASPRRPNPGSDAGASNRRRCSPAAPPAFRASALGLAAPNADARPHANDCDTVPSGSVSDGDSIADGSLPPAPGMEMPPSRAPRDSSTVDGSLLAAAGIEAPPEASPRDDNADCSEQPPTELAPTTSSTASSTASVSAGLRRRNQILIVADLQAILGNEPTDAPARGASSASGLHGLTGRGEKTGNDLSRELGNESGRYGAFSPPRGAGNDLRREPGNKSTTNETSVGESADAGSEHILIPGGGPLPRQVLERLACGADFFGLVFDGPGTPLWHGRLVRTATDAQWRALVARDRHCVLCDLGPQWCEAHHVVPWQPPALGPTDIDNLALLCGNCHDDLHATGAQLRRGPHNTWHRRQHPQRE